MLFLISFDIFAKFRGSLSSSVLWPIVSQPLNYLTIGRWEESYGGLGAVKGILGERVLGSQNKSGDLEADRSRRRTH